MADLRVLRTRPLPRGPIRGRFLVAHSVLEATSRALTVFALAGIKDGGHEGLVYWAGREIGDTTVFTTAVVPDAEHESGRVIASPSAVGEAARAARSLSLGLLAQVHSHPGQDTRHSDGDDDLVLLPFEGMLSIVIPRYGIEMEGLKGAGVHQFQRGRWVLCSRDSVEVGLVVLPSLVDLR